MFVRMNNFLAVCTARCYGSFWNEKIINLLIIYIYNFKVSFSFFASVAVSLKARLKSLVGR